MFRGDFLWLIGIVSVFSLGAFNFSFILLYGSQVGISGEFIPLLFALVNVAHVVVAIPAGLLSDRVGREKMLFVGYSVFLVLVFFWLLFVDCFSSFYLPYKQEILKLRLFCGQLNIS